MHDPVNEHEIRQRLRAAGPYPMESYQFIQDGLSYTARMLHEDHSHGMGDPDSHVSGQELCMGLRELAVQRYGLLAPAVMECWSITRTADFGTMVFAMIDAGLLKRQADDCIDDFEDVYDFREAFDPRELAAQIGQAQSG